MSPNPTKRPLRPAQYTGQELISAILNGKYPPGATLPSERRLSESLGVTRQTVREALQRMSAEGWISICHGKATRVNDFWKTGGLGLLGTLARHAESLSPGLIRYLLEFRLNILPDVAALAASKNPGAISSHLSKLSTSLPANADAFTRFDWDLQIMFARESKNPIYQLILNDFEYIFMTLGTTYFKVKAAREASVDYYKKLSKAVSLGPDNVRNAVFEGLETSIGIWESIKQDGFVKIRNQ
ncbi:MAG: GntR family transcriptional regulator [Deltaproteobacteria bacterium]|nr:GntR family transcriptional regulator [Deltaproteobacteria bacterium]